MRTFQYRRRLETDLNEWIAAGLVPEASRQPILASVRNDDPNAGRTWIATIAALFAGLAVIAFIADNWAAIPRGFKLILLISLFLTSALSAAWVRDTRQVLSNGLALVASLIFAASIALIGQAFNMPGDPRGAVLFSAISALAIGLAGRSPAASFCAIGFAFIWIGMRLGDWGFAPWLSPGFWLINLVAVGTGFAARTFRASSLWHATLLLAIALSAMHCAEIAQLAVFQDLQIFGRAPKGNGDAYLSVLSALYVTIWTGIGWYGWRRSEAELPGGRTLVGYASWAALGGLFLLGAPWSGSAELLHRIILIAAAVFTLWFGAKYSLGWVRAGGILALTCTLGLIFVDLGLSLSVAALILGLAALVSFAVVFLLQRRSNRTERAQS
ncbi:MAG: hypothetical protein CMK06_08330 [Ponticaulis sp.]|nr:hypothetical protein [Ponticaulis sp.]